jgi:hypothetical protein
MGLSFFSRLGFYFPEPRTKSKTGSTKTSLELFSPPKGAGSYPELIEAAKCMEHKKAAPKWKVEMVQLVGKWGNTTQN